MDIINKVNKYYTQKIKQFGIDSKGVDWNSKESQFLRFEQLTKIILKDDFSILDYGCGYGSLIEFLKLKYKSFNYLGIDISEEMIANAKQLYPDYEFKTQLQDKLYFDYIVASGIFNVKLDTSNQIWLDYIITTINQMNSLSRCGFAFNILTSYSDKEFMKDYLYYADPCFFFDYCKKNFSRNIALLHDYDLYEFTILVRK